MNLALVRHAFFMVAPLLVSACSSSMAGSSGQTSSNTPRAADSSTPNLIVSVPLPIPSSVLPASTGSGVPLDARVTDVPANDARTFVGLSRGTSSALDKMLAEGDEAYQRDDFVGALRAYEKALQLGAKSPAPIVGLVRTRLSVQRVPVELASAPGHPGLEQAVKDLEKAARLDGKFAPARLELGRSFLVLGRMDEALAHLRVASELAPEQAETHSAFGAALLATGVVENAMREFQIAAGIESNSAVRFKNLGTALLAGGKSVEAVQAFERAAQLAPDDARIQNQLGTALLTVGETERARKCLQTAVMRDPRKATYRSNLGYAWAQGGDLERAIVIYREALALDERLVSAWINLGNALAKQRKFAEAREAYGKALAIDSSDPRVQTVIDELKAIEAAAGTTPKGTTDRP